MTNIGPGYWRRSARTLSCILADADGAVKTSTCASCRRPPCRHGYAAQRSPSIYHPPHRCHAYTPTTRHTIAMRTSHAPFPPRKPARPLTPDRCPPSRFCKESRSGVPSSSRPQNTAYCPRTLCPAPAPPGPHPQLTTRQDAPPRPRVVEAADAAHERANMRHAHVWALLLPWA